jgi:dienelactone hydrolase
MTLRLAAAAAMIAAFSLPAHAQMDDKEGNPKLLPPVPVHEQVLHLSGDPDRPVDLVVTLYQPQGAGPFPLAVVNHGANGSKEKPADMARHRYTYSAYYFLSRGYAVAMPMARGYAGSGGTQTNHGCDLGELALENGRDIAGVISALGSFPQIDTSRTVVAGQSFGGWSTLGMAALNPPGVHGVVDFFGGVQSSGCGPIQGGELAGLVTGARRLGAATSIPSLWFYGENDSLFQPKLWRPMYEAYTREGGQATLVDVGSFMDDSHQMLSHMESFPIWVPKVDAFLARIGLPSREIYPEYMPLPWPAPTHFAPLADVDAVPWLSASSRETYQQFLTRPLPRMFLVAPGGQSVAVFGRSFDPLATGLNPCREHNLDCKLYAIDNDVVWNPATAPASAARPAATHFAAIDDVQAVPCLNAAGRAAYAQFLQRPSPRAFVLTASGQSAVTQGGADPLGRALALCKSHGLDCRPYAVNNDVVWVPPPPPRLPPATRFAKLSDVAAVPWVNDNSRAAYKKFLLLPQPRAFVVASTGQSVSSQGGYDPLARALGVCRQAGLICQPYAVNNQVVWTGK